MERLASWKILVIVVLLSFFFLLNICVKLESRISELEAREKEKSQRYHELEDNLLSLEMQILETQDSIGRIASERMEHGSSDWKSRYPRHEKLPFQARFAKPVIYLYPPKTTDISVQLHYTGKLTCTYPPIGNGWHVTAQPDGTLINHADKKEYSYLFWEGESETRFDMSRGFVVAGKDTAMFLQEKLAFMGLTPREYNEFIVYWLPQMQDNPYNLITFQDKDYTDQAKLVITPKPDSVLRVFMVYKPLQQKITVSEKALKRFTRKGFTVVEWGGGLQRDEGVLKMR